MAFDAANFVPRTADEQTAEPLAAQGFAAGQENGLLRPPSYNVRDERPRIARTWGLSSAEVTLLRASLRFLNRSRRRCLWAVLGDDLLGLPPSAAYDVFHDFKRRVVRDMSRAGEPPWWLAVAETTAGLHFNMVFPAPPGFDERMRRWTPFQPYLQSEQAVQWVDEAKGGFRGLTSYLAKERTSQAEWWHGCDLGPRLKGAHRTGDPVIDAADQVTVSRALGATLLRDGAVKPFQRTTRKNRVATTAISTPIAGPATASQPEKIEVVAALLPAAEPTAASRVPVGEVTMGIPTPEPVQLSLFDALPEREHLGCALRDARRRLGLSQAAAAKLIGLRQPHMSNTEAGRHPIARARVRALQYLAERKAA